MTEEEMREEIREYLMISERNDFLDSYTHYQWLIDDYKLTMPHRPWYRRWWSRVKSWARWVKSWLR